MFFVCKKGGSKYEKRRQQTFGTGINIEFNADRGDRTVPAPKTLAATDATSTVRASGTYNSIVVANSDLGGVYGIVGSNDMSVIMTGERKINVKNIRTGETGNQGAYACGNSNIINLSSDDTNGVITIDVEAKGSVPSGADNEADSANAKANGIRGYGNIAGNVNIKATATGGKAIGDASAEIKGIATDDLTVTGNVVINATATGGTSTSNDEDEGRAMAYAIGMDLENTIEGNLTLNITAIGGTSVKGYAEACAYGLFTYDATATNVASGNVSITVNASAKQAGEGFLAFSMYASEGTNDLSGTGKIKTIEGDVFSDSRVGNIEHGGINNITLDTPTSYLQGNIVADKLGENNITISNGATWRPVYDNRYGTDCVMASDANAATINVATNKVAKRTTTYDSNNSVGTTITLNKDGIIDLTWDGWGTNGYDTTRAYRSVDNNSFRKLTVAKLTGSDGILKVDSNLANNRADELILGTDSTVTSLKVQVNYDNFYANSAKGDGVTGKALVVTDNSSGTTLATVTGTQSEYNEKTYEVTVAKDTTNTNQWNLTKIEDITEPKPDPTPTPTPTPVYITENTKHAADSRDNVNNIWEIETNSLRKRLGDLRSMDSNNHGEKYDNMWAKYGHGTQILGNRRDTELQYNQFQIGYDKAFAKKNGKVYRGIMVSRINGDASYERGSGNTNSTTLGLYQTWMGDKGHYYDIVLKAGKIDTDYNVTDLSDNYSHGDYDMWGTALSGEYGWRKSFGSGAYMEPSAEVIFSHVGSTSYTTSKNMNVYLDATKHAITRLGFALGKEFNKGNAYFKGNYYHDFAGGGGVTTGTVRYENEHAKNWYEFGIGGDVQLAKNCSAYAEVKKIFKDIHSNVNYSLGARWTF